MGPGMRRALAALTCAAALATIAACLTPPAAAAPRTASSPPYPASLIVKTEFRLKADLVRRNLKKAPQLVFFGGSRSQRFDPVFAQQRTGLRAVNIAHSCARPEAAWAGLNWFYKRWPNAKIRWVWGMQSGMLRDRDLDAALLQDKRFYPYFPADLLKKQRAKLPSSPSKMPRTYGFLGNRYSSRGLLVWNRYDKRRAAGYPLRKALDAYIARMLRGRTASMPDTRARRYFEDTVRLLNEHGTTPVIVLMPIHPRVLRVMKEHDMGGERQRLRDYLAALAETHDIKVLDFTTIGSFNGRASWFYDGVHITRRNTNRVITALKLKAREQLK
ncbi:MAG: hypothetical protein GX624_08005 [Actinobacteria bacterium]|nr:hypothetical protein [Actinomycetota bacterium]